MASVLRILTSRPVRSHKLGNVYSISHHSGNQLGRSNHTQTNDEVKTGIEESTRDVVGVHRRWKNGGGVYEQGAEIDQSAVVEQGAVVHQHAKLGPNVHIGSGSVVGPSVCIGSSTRIGDLLTGEARVLDSKHMMLYWLGLQPDDFSKAEILQPGFGHLVDDGGRMVKKPQALNVKIGDHVEIGANTCIDRGSWRDTEIGNHTKMDNLVQIGHNVVIGSCCMLCGQVGIAGSATLGDYVILGGKVGVKDHISIVSKVRVAAMSGVINNILEPGDYGGFPAMPIHEWRKLIVSLRKPANNSK